MCSNIIKNSDYVEWLDYQNFVGREGILDIINKTIESVIAGGGRSIINLFGIGGIGKTSILEYVKCELESNGTPSASVDFKTNGLDVYSIINSLYESLMKASVNSPAAFKCYNAVQKEMSKVEEKLLKQIDKKNGNALKKLLFEPVSESAIDVGEHVGESIGSSIVTDSTSTVLSGVLSSVGCVAGKIVGTIAKAGIGLAIAKMNEHRSQDCITALNQSGLKSSDIQIILKYKQKLVSAFIEGVNKLAENDESLILGFDTFEKAPTTVSQWLRHEIIPNLSNKIIVFICGREKITNEMLWSDISNMINSIPVDVFTPEEAEEYLISKNIKDKNRINWIINFTGRLPWALALIVDFIGDTQGLNEISTSENFNQERIGEQVVGRFLDHITDENLKEAIYVCASANFFTFDMLSSYFAYHDKENKITNKNIIGIFKEIRDYSFTRKLDDGKYAIHDVVSGFLINGQRRFNMSRYKEQNRFFCTYYRKCISSTYDVLEKVKLLCEYLYHCINYNELTALNIIDKFLVDSIQGIPLDIFEEFLYAGLVKCNFTTELGNLYYDFSKAQILYTTGNWEQAEVFLKKIIEQSKSISRSVPLECGIFTLAELYLGQGHYNDVKLLLEDLMRHGKVLSLRKRKKVSARLNEVYAILGTYMKGEQLALKSIDNSKRENDPIGVAWACKSLGDIYRLWGKQEQAISSLVESLKIFIKQKDSFGEAVARTQLARNYTHIGKWEKAEEELKKSEKIYKQYGYKYGIANVLLFRGNILRLKHQWPEALKSYQQSLKIHTTMKSWREISPLLGSMGLVYYHIGKRNDANNCFEESMRLKREQGYIRGVMFTQMYIGDCFFMDNQWDHALETYTIGRSEIKNNAKPIYVCDELDLKIFLCKLAKKIIKIDKIEIEYNTIKNKITEHNYNHLVAFLEFFFCSLQNELSATEMANHIEECMKYAKRYNNFLFQYYSNCFRDLISERFLGLESDMLIMKLET